MPNERDRQRQQAKASSHSQRGGTGALMQSSETHPEASNPGNRENAPGNNIGYPSNPERRAQNWLLVIFTGLILIVTGVYAYFSYGQWSSMDKTIGETQKSRELEYRAYVGAKGATYHPRADNPAWGDVNLIVINSGRTPIREGKIRRVFEVRDAPPPETTLINEDTHPASKVVYIPQIEYSHYVGAIPTQVADILANTPATQNAQPKQQGAPTSEASPIVPSLNPPEMPEFGKGWYVYGIIDYKDIFEQWHSTKFCFFIAPKKSSFIQCPTFNDSN